MIVLLIFGKSILGIFNENSDVIEVGYVRLFYILISYIFSLLYDNQAGYMRGFGISFTPACMTIIGVCVTRIIWRYAIFPKTMDFKFLMIAYPVSLCITAILMFCALMYFKPSKRYREQVLIPADE